MDNKTLMKSLGENFKKARERKKLTQSQLAEKMGCKQSFVSKLERGVREPNLATLVTMQNILKIKVLQIKLTPDPAPQVDAVAEAAE